MFERIKKLFKSEYVVPTRHDSKRFDCRQNGWGHACHLEREIEPIENWKFWDVSGHLTPLPRYGDEVIKLMGSGKATLFVFTEIRPARNVRDMFFGKAVCIAYLEDLEKKEITTEYSPESQIAPLKAAGYSDKEIGKATGLTPPGGTDELR